MEEGVKENEGRGRWRTKEGGEGERRKGEKENEERAGTEGEGKKGVKEKGGRGDYEEEEEWQPKFNPVKTGKKGMNENE